MTRRDLRLAVTTAVVVLLAIFVLGEVVLRVVSPTEYMYPRYKFSPEYGITLFANTSMVHVSPGKFKYRYGVNELGYRGPATEVADHYDRPNVLLLGDSYTFGMGVDDGEEYAIHLQHALADRANVINLGTPGWGLTQQVRRYLELGRRYQPAAVVLQFCANDPSDNFANRVARVENGEIVLATSDNSMNVVKKYLSRSIIQRSQLYNFFRGRVAGLLERRHVNRTERKLDDGGDSDDGVSPREGFYNDLLDAFVRTLHEDGVPLVMIAVNGQLDRFPAIAAHVGQLADAGDIDYVEVLDVVDSTDAFRSPEGHVWGVRAHYEIGKYLAPKLASHIGN